MRRPWETTEQQLGWKELWERVKDGHGFHQVCLDTQDFLGLMEEHQDLLNNRESVDSSSFKIKSRAEYEKELQLEKIPGCAGAFEDVGLHIVHLTKWLMDSVVNARMQTDRVHAGCNELVDSLKSLLLNEPMADGSWAHMPYCSGDRKSKPGTRGVSCCCTPIYRDEVEAALKQELELRRNVNPHTLRRMILHGDIKWGLGIPQWPTATLESTIAWAKTTNFYVRPELSLATDQT